mgnify:CR=1 FL=1
MTHLSIPRNTGNMIEDYGGRPTMRNDCNSLVVTSTGLRQSLLTCPPKTDPTLELEFWKRRKGRYGTQEVHT